MNEFDELHAFVDVIRLLFIQAVDLPLRLLEFHPPLRILFAPHVLGQIPLHLVLVRLVHVPLEHLRASSQCCDLITVALAVLAVLIEQRLLHPPADFFVERERLEDLFGHHLLELAGWVVHLGSLGGHKSHVLLGATPCRARAQVVHEARLLAVLVGTASLVARDSRIAGNLGLDALLIEDPATTLEQPHIGVVSAGLFTLGSAGTGKHLLDTLPKLK